MQMRATRAMRALLGFWSVIGGLRECGDFFGC
jgi:hypothetical protein